MVRLVLLPHHEAVKPKEVAMPQRNVPRPAAVYGIDIGKNIFHVVGLGSDGVPVQKIRFRRDTLLQFFERAAPAIVGWNHVPALSGLPGRFRRSDIRCA